MGFGFNLSADIRISLARQVRALLRRPLLQSSIMAFVSWQFGTGGWRVVVASPDRSVESTLNGDLAVAELTLSFTRYFDGQPSTSNVAMSIFGNGSITFSDGPVGVRVLVSFVGDGFLTANWQVSTNNIIGKGHGKGAGSHA